MNICVVGTGYVGLVTGAVFADLGNEGVCVDNQPDKSAAPRAGRMPIYEPGLEEMVARNVADGRLSFSTDLADGVRRSVIVFITVGTPPMSDGQTDLTAVGEVARGIGEAMERYTVVVNKSTVPVGTGDFVRDVIARHQKRPVPFDVVSNPEFLREGSAIEDTLRPDRIVIGAPTQQVAMTLVELYAPIERPMILTDLPSAEVIKYASNAFLATKISFINAIANICEAAVDTAKRLLPSAVTFSGSPAEAAGGAHAAVVVTEWTEFKYLHLARLRGQLTRPMLFHGRNLWEPERMPRLGFEYYSVGR